MQRRQLKLQRRQEQDGKCPICKKPLPESYAVLDRIDAMRGYTPENTRLIPGLRRSSSGLEAVHLTVSAGALWNTRERPGNATRGVSTFIPECSTRTRGLRRRRSSVYDTAHAL